ncbi:CynX/NimT family MFS transporter [Candidatus Bipolaricaulota bacterium]
MINTVAMNPDSNARWGLLGLAGLTAALAVAAPTMAMPVLFAEIADDLHLSLVQIGAIWGLVSFAGLFTGLAGGMLGDRFGTKRTIAVACLALGLFGAARGLSNSLVAMSVTVFLSGLASAMIPVNLHKACAYWFSGKRLGLANAVISGGMALGFMVGSLISATVLSPWLGGWRGVLYFYGGISVLLSVPWFLAPLSQEEQRHLDDHHSAPSFRHTLAHVIRLRDVWILGVGLLGVGGGVQGLLGYLPLYLRQIGWTATRADAALSGFHAISLLAVVPLAGLAGRLISRKHFLVVAALATACGIGLLSIVGGAAIWIGVLVAGAVRDGYMAVFMTTAIEAEGVGAAYAGTALGLTLTLARIGGLIAPPLGNSLATYSQRLPFVLWGLMALLGLVVLRLGRGSRRVAV